MCMQNFSRRKPRKAMGEASTIQKLRPSRLMLVKTKRTATADSTGLRFATPTVFRAPLAIRVGTAGADVVRQVTIDRGEQTVFDLAGPLKLGNEWHGNGPNSCEDHADRDNAREQKAFVRRRHITAPDHHPAENENKEQWLQESLQKKLNCIAPRYVGVACQHRAKSFPVQSRRLRPVWCRKRFSKLGSEM